MSDECTMPSPGRRPIGLPETPPKTPGKSPRGLRGSRPSTPSAAVGACVPAAPSAPSSSARPKSFGSAWSNELALPYSVSETLTQIVWASARSQVIASAAEKRASGVEQSPKRRRGQGGECVAEEPASQSTPFVVSFSSQASQTSGLATQTSQASQASQVDDTNAAAADAIVTRAQGILEARMREGLCGHLDAVQIDSMLGRIRGMALASMNYWREVSFDLGRAASSLLRFSEYQRQLYWRKAPWRGVNLGGWLLLEPGPCEELFRRFGGASCELDLTLKIREQLGAEGSQMALKAHRETFVTEEDFKRIKGLGLNAVRIPFGYWALNGPSNGDEFDGPCIEYLDRAVAWAEAHNLQVLLDLHGAPGGENAERVCGRERQGWQWKDWRMDESISILRAIAQRYKGRAAISGISVCNEPSSAVPAEVLCRFYDRAVTAVREGGMRPDEVAVTLPIFRTERLDEIWRVWNREFDGFARHSNTAFDLHVYHCFGPWWKRQNLSQHMRMTKRHRKILRRVPAVVGEWSLALPSTAWGADGGSTGNAATASSSPTPTENQAVTAFASAQIEAYSQASHGWFFWNWRDGCTEQHHAAWDMRQCVERRWLTDAQLEGRTSQVSPRA